MKICSGPDVGPPLFPKSFFHLALVFSFLDDANAKRKKSDSGWTLHLKSNTFEMPLRINFRLQKASAVWGATDLQITKSRGTPVR